MYYFPGDKLNECSVQKFKYIGLYPKPGFDWLKIFSNAAFRKELGRNKNKML